MAVRDRINSTVRRIPTWPIYVLGLAYACWLFWLGASDQLGAEPVKTLEHELGEMALYLLILGLMITPLRRYANLNLVKFRRAIGVTCFFLVVLHLLTWAILDVQQLNRVWADIVKRPYITVGMAAFALLLPLAVTSNNLSVRRLGPAWRKLHALVYLAALLGGIHYLMLVKGFQIRPIIFLLIIVGLLALRAKSIRGLLGL